MFETVVPKARRKRVFYETLPLSIAIHVIAMGTAVIGAVWNVVFPLQSPRVVRAYSLVSLPDPPPPPPPPAAPPPEPNQVQLPKAQPLEPDKIVAPTVIPDTIPQLPDSPPPLLAPPPAAQTAEAGASGSADGNGGDIGGSLHGIAGGIAFPDDGRVHIERDEQLPLRVVSQEYPRYPDEARKKQLEDQVIVRYTIGKNGRVIDVQIIDHAKEVLFDEATVEAIRQWRFRPMIKDGKPVEVVHELAVNYILIRR